MITYQYECQSPDCKLGFEIQQRITAKTLRKCPLCKRKTLERIMGTPIFFVSKEPTTLGQQAERNDKKFGKEKLAKLREQHKRDMEAARSEGLKELEKKLPPGAKLLPKQQHKPWYGKLPDHMKKVSDPKRIEKYVREGK